MKPSLSLVAAAAALLFAAAPAHAEREWGALALSERSTAYGYAKDFDTQESASERAMAECAKNASDCRLHTAFRNTCLVLAGSVDGPFGWAWGAPANTRAQRALEQCRQRGAINCKVVETVCAGTAGGPATPGHAPRTRGPARPATPAATTPPANTAPPPATTPPAAATPPRTATPPAAVTTPPAETRPPGTPTPLHKN
jgi:hypothetical protein